MIDQIELLKLIEKNSQLTAAEIATQLGAAAADVEKEIADLKAQNIILGSTTMINWDETNVDTVTAMIEVRITPVREKGFDKLADILCEYENVTACYLMSGGFDLMLIYEGKNLRDIASFVYDKVATQEGVLSTATHFILRKYKDNGILFKTKDSDDRQAIVL